MSCFGIPQRVYGDKAIYIKMRNLFYFLSITSLDTEHIHQRHRVKSGKFAHTFANSGNPDETALRFSLFAELMYL